MSLRDGKVAAALRGRERGWSKLDDGAIASTCRLFFREQTGWAMAQN
jgi:hypothetical protein